MALERWLEFHDSKLTAVCSVPRGVRVDLDAYVQQWEGEDAERSGAGWIQPVQIEITGDTAPSNVAVPIDLLDGQVVAASLPSSEAGTLTLPIVLEEDVTLVLETVSGETFRFSGARLAVTVSGEPRFVENLPREMDPQGRPTPGDA